MSKAVWTKFITDNAGAVVEGASVTVFLSDGITPATIYSDPAGSAKVNPFLTPAGGKAEFYADPGIYVIQASKDGKTATWNNEEIGHARRDLDLSDLDSAATARTNLGLKSAAVADIIGTVSQSGGVPTGSVIQRGTNANGEFVKFADGTLICTYTFPLVTAANMTIPGQLHNFGTWTFPAAFLTGIKPTISLCPNHNGLSAAGRQMAVSALSSANLHVDYITLEHLQSGQSLSVWIDCSAIGRWF